MKASAFKYALLSVVTSLAMFTILLMPFHGFLTVWLSSLIGHYTALRLWKEVILLLSGLGVLYLLLFDQKIRSHTMTRRLVWLILAYGVINLVWGAVAFHNHAVTAKALGYGLIVDLRFLLFFLITWSCALRLARLRVHWQWVVLWPAAIVVAFGVLQAFVLPHDFLRHFGYGPHTISAYETINHNQHYIRIASTLRGANPLGAYLIIPITLLTILLARGKRLKLYGAFLAASLIALFFTFSRSAWIGAVLSMGTVLWLSLKSQQARKMVLFGAICLLVVASATTIIFRHNTRYQNFVLHTQTHSAVKQTSNEGHLAALKTGAKDIAHHPLGTGPGTAGPASVYNDKGAR
ncbi:MAG TPA: O-antigen ligase family protein, partial [Candidatus Saccharimonadales bacterium]